MQRLAHESVRCACTAWAAHKTAQAVHRAHRHHLIVGAMKCGRRSGDGLITRSPHLSAGGARTRPRTRPPRPPPPCHLARSSRHAARHAPRPARPEVQESNYLVEFEPTAVVYHKGLELGMNMNTSAVSTTKNKGSSADGCGIIVSNTCCMHARRWDKELAACWSTSQERTQHAIESLETEH